MNRIFMVSALLALVTVSTLSPAFAQAATDTQVTIPYGEIVGQVAGLLAGCTAAFIAWILRSLPAQYAAIAKTARLDQLLARAIDYGINTTVNASKDKVLNVDVGNQVLAQALGYVIKAAPGWMVAWAGGVDGVRDKIIARLELDEKAAIK